MGDSGNSSVRSDADIAVRLRAVAWFLAGMIACVPICYTLLVIRETDTREVEIEQLAKRESVDIDAKISRILDATREESLAIMRPAKENQ